MLNADHRPIIGITMGDAAGIGPEIVDKALSKQEIYQISRPIVIGDLSVLVDALKVAKVNLKFESITTPSSAKFEFGTVDVIDLKNIRLSELRMGQVQAMAGKASVEYVKKAVELALKGEIDAIVTAPLNKEAMNMGGYDYAGHTEILADLTKTKDYAMMLVAGRLRVVHVTTHVSIREACSLIKRERVSTVIRLTNEVLQKLGIEKPRIAVAGLNPHAGEGGMFGDEEIREIAPAIEASRNSGIDVVGPMPPDTVFLRANRGEYDAVVAMYHDQGHIPVKMLGFESGVNVTIGLPIIRTSVDHGTAYRRAGLRLGTGDPTSLEEAIRLAVQMAGSSRQSPALKR
ncbi:4-hydroxythreonine-4-phosphate dehydrogenase PdxA [Candidatus Bathyarchaeota archaeon]|nr:4-hydroxythreonine-4-phosphate dehydrogenase PdxA [Candidatus Bathyarchaeota archaeon]